MKKLSKLMALLLSLLMIVSLFAACGDDKKDDDKKEETTAAETKEKLTGKDLLLGTWDAVGTLSEDMPINVCVQYTFEKDGTVTGFLSEANYNDFVKQLVEYFLEQYGVEDYTDEDLQESIEAYKKEMPYKDIASSLEDFGTWELDGDTLIISDGEESEPKVIETELSKGVDSFEYSDEEGTIKFKKAN